MTTNPARVAFQAFAPIYDEFCRANDYEMWVGALLLELEKRGLVHGRALDVGCGTGRAFQPLLSRGWQIVGCDLSPAMLAEARRKFDGRVPLHEADIRELPIIGKFELVFALNDVINYLIEDGDLDRAFEGIRANLAPGGLALFDTNTLATLRSSSDEEIASQDRGEWLWEGLTKDAVPGAIFDSRISGSGVKTHIHRERHHTARAISESLEAAGLELLASLGQQEINGAVCLTEPPDEGRDHKIIHICRPAAG